MNKLPNTIVAFASRRKDYSPALRVGRPMPNPVRTDAGAPVCRWQRDPVSHRLYCVWGVEGAARSFDEETRLRLAG